MRACSVVNTAAAFVLAWAISLCSPVYAADYVPGEILVRYKAGMQAQAQATIAGIGARTIRSTDQTRFHRLKLPPGVTVEDAITRLKKNPNVDYVGPNHLIHICREPNDYNYTTGYFDVFTQWGLYSPDYPGAGIEAPQAWDITTGSSDVVIAIIDTGVMTNHEDLWQKIVPGRNTISGASPDDYDDDHGHGTFVAGVAAAMSDNWIGCAGVSWGAKVMPVKVIGSDGSGTEDDAAAGIIWAADHGAKVLNMSFAGIDVPAEQSAIEYAWGKGCILVAATGNEDTDVPQYPAAYDQVLAVGATNEYGERCTTADWGEGGSNYGSHIDVMAPGNMIVSTSNGMGLFGDYYDVESGTSAAAPFVSGTAALLCSQYPGWTNTQVVEQIKNTCRDISPAGWDQYTGWGLISAYHALADAPTEGVKLGDLANIGSGTVVTIPNVVLTSRSADFTDRLYVESPDRIAGAVLTFAHTPPAWAEGDIVEVRGTVMSINGERGLQNTTLTKKGHQNPLAPFAISNRSAGGGRLTLKAGVTNGFGLNNLGLLVTVYGRVTTYPGWTYFYIDDGSRNFDGSGFIGLKIICGSMTKPAAGSFVRVTGISSCEQPAGAGVTIPAIRPRRQADIRIIQ